MKKENKYKISVTGKIKYDNEDCGETKEEGDGIYEELLGCHILRYDVTEAKSRIPTHNEIAIQEGLIVVKKTGAVNTVMRFREGEEERAKYITGQGALDFTIKCSGVNFKISDQRIMASIEYSMWQCDEKISENRILIRAQEII